MITLTIRYTSRVSEVISEVNESLTSALEADGWRFSYDEYNSKAGQVTLVFTKEVRDV